MRDGCVVPNTAGFSPIDVAIAEGAADDGHRRTDPAFTPPDPTSCLTLSDFLRQAPTPHPLPKPCASDGRSPSGATADFPADGGLHMAADKIIQIWSA